MFLAHSFRLRDPWQCEALPGDGVRWSRVFHRPTGLEGDDALWLVCSGLPPQSAVTVNGQRVAPTKPDGPNEFEVTNLLAESNRIEILVPSDLQPTAYGLQPSPPPFPYDVRLAIVGHS